MWDETVVCRWLNFLLVDVKTVLREELVVHGKGELELDVISGLGPHAGVEHVTEVVLVPE